MKTVNPLAGACRICGQIETVAGLIDHAGREDYCSPVCVARADRRATLKPSLPMTITITCAVFAAATMAGCATKPRATLRPLDHFEADRIKLQVASMDAAVAGIVFHPIANR